VGWLAAVARHGAAQMVQREPHKNHSMPLVKKLNRV